jgi:hypothetical protein
MYQISFPQTSNRADWVFTGQITDANTGDLLDLSSLSFVFSICDQDNCPRLTASTANGKFTVLGLGIFRWQFTKAEMSTLCAGTYPTGFTMSNSDPQTVQLSTGSLPIVDGDVP